MKVWLLATLCLALTAPALAQSSDEPASRDDVILYLRTMHSHDMMARLLEVQSRSVHDMLRDQVMKEKGSVPADFDTKMAKGLDALLKGMPMDEIIQAMIPAYQNHFTKGDIEAMTAFYASPVGQKVLQELPAVMQEGMKEAMPIMSKYLSEWKERMDQEVKEAEGDSKTKAGTAKP